jgi:hypothetical protein
LHKSPGSSTASGGLLALALTGVRVLKRRLPLKAGESHGQKPDVRLRP